MKRRRIALVVPALEEGGGVPAVAMFLHGVLRDTGRYEPELVSVSCSLDDPASVRIADPSSWFRGVTVREGEYEGEPFRHVGAVFPELETRRYRRREALDRVLREHDLIQVVAGFPSWAAPALGLGRPVGLQVATLVEVERKSILAESRGLRGALLRYTSRRLKELEHVTLERVDRTFVENSWMFEHVKRVAGAERTVFAPPGVDTDRFTPAGEPGHDGPILCVGRFSDRRKNVALLFRAYAKLVAARPDAPELVLAGAVGPTEGDRELARSLGILDRVRVHEDVPADRLVELYQEASMYVLSSDEEGLGIVILEAMAAGIPVVSTDCGGPSTSVVEGETGFLTPLEDDDALADRMERLVGDRELRASMGTAGRARAVAEFSIQATGQRFVDWYDEALA